VRGSLGALVDRLSSAAREAGVAIQLGAAVNSVVQTDVEGTGVRVVVTSSNTDGVTETTTARAVVLAAPPRVLLQHVTFDPALPRKCLSLSTMITSLLRVWLCVKVGLALRCSISEDSSRRDARINHDT
jgi:phytoene dehydrogenase-like protein